MRYNSINKGNDDDNNNSKTATKQHQRVTLKYNNVNGNNNKLLKN